MKKLFERVPEAIQPEVKNIAPRKGVILLILWTIALHLTSWSFDRKNLIA